MSESFEPGYLHLYIFGRKNVTDSSSRLLLVFLKNYMSSDCLLYVTRYNILKIAGCTGWRILTKYAIVRWQNFWHWRTFSRCRFKWISVVFSEDVPSYPWRRVRLLSFVQTEEAFKMSPGRDAHAKLSVKKTVEILYCRVVESTCSW